MTLHNCRLLFLFNRYIIESGYATALMPVLVNVIARRFRRAVCTPRHQQSLIGCNYAVITGNGCGWRSRMICVPDDDPRPNQEAVLPQPNRVVVLPQPNRVVVLPQPNRVVVLPQPNRESSVTST